jgi:GH18 family chitinase
MICPWVRSPDLNPGMFPSLTMTLPRIASLVLAILFTLGWSGLDCAAAEGQGLPARHAHLARSWGGDSTAPYQVSAAYPFWRASQFPPDAIPFEYVDEIGHFSIWPGPGGTLEVPSGFLMPALIQQAHQFKRTVVLGVGGANSHSAFAPMASDPVDRGAFVRNLVGFVVDHGYDGVSIDWEFPRTPEDRQNLSALMAELRAGLDATGRDLKLSIAVTSNEQRGQWIDTATITPLVHHYVVMTFGYYGAWGSESGHNAPLYPPLSGIGDQRSVDRSLRYWTETRGVPGAKIRMGIAAFGIWFDSEGLYQPFSSTAKADYRTVKVLVGDGYSRHWDSVAQVPFLTRDVGPGLWSYDDPHSVGLKRDYVLAHGLGGVAVWDVTMDLVAGEHELLKALSRMPPPHSVYVPLLRRDR